MYKLYDGAFGWAVWQIEDETLNDYKLRLIFNNSGKSGFLMQREKAVVDSWADLNEAALKKLKLERL